MLLSPYLINSSFLKCFLSAIFILAHSGWSLFNSYVLAERRIDLLLPNACYNCRFIFSTIGSGIVSSIAYVMGIRVGIKHSIFSSSFLLLIPLYSMVKFTSKRSFLNDQLEQVTISLNLFRIIFGFFIVLLIFIPSFTIGSFLDILVALCLLAGIYISTYFMKAGEEFVLSKQLGLFRKEPYDNIIKIEVMLFLHRTILNKEQSRSQLLMFSGYMVIHFLNCKNPLCPLSKYLARLKLSEKSAISNVFSKFKSIHRLISSFYSTNQYEFD